MNNDIKVEKYYSTTKLHWAIMMMEQMWILSKKATTEKDKICAKALHEHFKRLAMCILMKEMPDELNNDLVVDIEYMENLYKGYAK